MELVLNLVWLVAAFGVAIRFAIWRRGQPAARQRAVALCAVCVLALLFPIISATDDLHTDTAGAEETSAMRRAAVVATAHVVSAAVTHAPAAITRDAALALSGIALRDQRLPMLAGFAVASSLRGPPSFQR